MKVRGASELKKKKISDGFYSQGGGSSQSNKKLVVVGWDNTFAIIFITKSVAAKLLLNLSQS